MGDLQSAASVSQAPEMPPTPSVRRRARQNTPLSLPSPSPSPTESNSDANFKLLAAQALSAISTRVTTKDEYATFGEYIASELRSLGGQRAVFVKRKLQRAFLEFVEEAELMVKPILFMFFIFILMILHCFL